MKSLQGRKILLVCSDPGAAQAVLLSLYRVLRRGGAYVAVVARRSGERIAKREGIPLERRRVAYGLLRSITSYLTHTHPQCIITGTSLRDDLERNYIRAGRLLKIPTISFIDWWTSIMERFSHSRSGEIALPDWICVTDRNAERLIKKVFGSKARLVVTGHPYLVKVAAQNPLTAREKQALRRKMHILISCPMILFFPEPTNPPTGFDQFAIFERIVRELSRVVQGSARSVNLILKFHPNGQQPVVVSRYKHIVARHGDPQIHVRYLLNEYPTQTLIDLADFVWGMNTTPLLEAMLRGKLVSAFLPDVSIPGIPFSKEAGFCPSANSYKEIPHLIRSLLTDSRFVRKALVRQKQYKLPKENFEKKVISLIRSSI